MSAATVRLPSPGFVALCLVYAGVVAFFAWGLRTPALDRVWRVHHELKIGEQLSESDRRVVEVAMSRHPELADALAGERPIGIISAHGGGWIETPRVSIIRAPVSKSDRIALDVQTPSRLIPYTMRLSAKGFERDLKIEKPGRYEMELPPPDGKAVLLQLELEGKGFRADPSLLGVRVTFCCEDGLGGGARR